MSKIIRITVSITEEECRFLDKWLNRSAAIRLLIDTAMQQTNNTLKYSEGTIRPNANR